MILHHLKKLNWLAGCCTRVVQQAMCGTAALLLLSFTGSRGYAPQPVVFESCLQFHVLAQSFQRLAHLLLL